MNWRFIIRHALFGAGIGLIAAGISLHFGLWHGAALVAVNAAGWYVREGWDHGWSWRFDAQGHAEWIAPALACAVGWLVIVWLALRAIG